MNSTEWLAVKGPDPSYVKVYGPFVQPGSRLHFTVRREMDCSNRYDFVVTFANRRLSWRRDFSRALRMIRLLDRAMRRKMGRLATTTGEGR